MADLENEQDLSLSDDSVDSDFDDLLLKSDDIESDQSSEEDSSDTVDFEDNVHIHNLIKGLGSEFCTLVQRYLIPAYQEINTCFDDGVPFLVDGDTLMAMIASNGNWPQKMGGSSLHLIYLFELHLNIFVSRGGTFQIVFFNVWEIIYNATMKLYRDVLIKHLSHNSQYVVHIVEHCFDEKFNDLIETLRPGFFHTNFDFVNSHLYMDIPSIKYARNIYIMHLIKVLSSDLPCIDTCYIKPDVTLVWGFYLSCSVAVNTLAENYSNSFKTFLEDVKNQLLSKPVSIPNITEIKNIDVRSLIVINTAYVYHKDHKNENMLKLFLLNDALVNCLKIENRCCPDVIHENNDLREQIIIWHICMLKVLKSQTITTDRWNNIADVWQGLLFEHLCYFLQSKIVDGSQLGGNVARHYEMLVKELRKFDIDLEPYPLCMPNFQLKSNKKNDLDEILTLESRNMYNIENPLVKEFCGDFLKNMKWSDPPLELNQQTYKESHHYHNLQVLKDQHDYVKCSSIMPTDPIERKRFLKSAHKGAKYMAMYGSSIEGKYLTTRSIIREDTKSSTKKKDLKKTGSKKKQAILDNIKSEKLKLKTTEEIKILEIFKVKLNKYNVDFKLLLQNINLIINRMTQPASSLEALTLKMHILIEIFKERSKEKNPQLINLTNEIFLIGRNILCKHSIQEMTMAQQKTISSSLCIIGFDNIAIRNGLPVNTDKNYVSKNWVRYQLEYLGSQLERTVTGMPDKRVSGFIPDPWQKELFDIIDHKQSALIIAPTSSGKTYASYYCMESVLREGTDGIVVYVSPTKALVNQVAATVYARFKDTKMPPGQSVYGVLTRDYKTNSLNCQILITVPQMLEILLLSPRRYKWVQKLRYVIFDEVHCIAGNLGGSSWETCLLMIKCPFLALSATIRQPHELLEWLNKAEIFKRKRDVKDGLKNVKMNPVKFVECTERHSDLVKYNYSKNMLNHMHPFETLEEGVMRTYSKIPGYMFLSPKETLQLYDAMSQIDLTLSEISPEIYFSNCSVNGFITRNSVREYEKMLSSLLTDWYNNKKSDFLCTIELLKSDKVNKVYGNNVKYVTDNIIELVLHLQEKNMLPAIIFSYNRNLVDGMLKNVTDYFMKTQIRHSNRIDKKHDKQEKKKLKELEKIIVKNKMEMSIKSKKPESCILQNNVTGLKGIGTADSADIQFIERRLCQVLSPKHIIVSGMKCGLGAHHSGYNNKIRSAVEMLFRMKILNVVFATGTLALGIHMPCKTVVIAGDSPWLNALEYHQMSGRAGRRGFDTTGNIIFFGLNDKKKDTILTAQLPVIKGHFPLNITTILRLMLLVSDITDNEKHTDEAEKYAISRVLTFLENTMIFQSRPELKQQVKYYFCFVMQFLVMQEFIDTLGKPLKWCGLATHLNYHEPGVLAFIYLLRTGAFRDLSRMYDNEKDVQFNFLVVLSHLFTKFPLNSITIKKRFKNSKVILDPLPELIKKALKTYNKQAYFVFNQYYSSFSEQSTKPDNTLPLSKIEITNQHNEDEELEHESLFAKFLKLCSKKKICSSFAALSGINDEIFKTSTNNTNNVKNEFHIDMDIVPWIQIDAKINAYAVDFYRHGILNSIRNDNGLSHGKEFDLLFDFLLVLKAIRTSLTEIMCDYEVDCVYYHFDKLTWEYSQIFSRAFPNSRG